MSFVFLTDRQIDNLITTHPNALQPYDRSKLGAISYDLQIECINICDDSNERGKRVENHILKTGETVFISCTENIWLPNDYMGIIVQRNSRIRRGLYVDSPVYHPGHHTKIFLRVANVSKDHIRLKKGDSIASIMFNKLDEEVEHPYEGVFSDEFDFSGIAKYPSSELPDVIELQEKVESVEEVEKRIYNNVVIVMTIFIGIFSLINLNVGFFCNLTLKDMLTFNLIFLGGIGVLVSFVGLITGKLIPRKSGETNQFKWLLEQPLFWIFAISILLLIGSVLLVIF